MKATNFTLLILILLTQSCLVAAQKKAILTITYPENNFHDSITYVYFDGYKFKDIIPKREASNEFVLELSYEGEYFQLKIIRNFLNSDESSTIHERLFYSNKDSSKIAFNSLFLSNGHSILGNATTQNIIDATSIFDNLFLATINENERLNSVISSFQNGSIKEDSIFSNLKQLKLLGTELLKKQLKYVAAKPNEYSSLIILEHLVSNSLCLDDSLLLATCQKLDSSLKSTKEYELLAQKVISSDCYRWGNIGGNEIANLDSLNQKKIKRPSLRGLDVNENEFDLDSTLGRRVLLNFWATWCGPCILEIPEIIKFKEKYPEIEIISVAWDTEAELVKTKMQELRITWKVIMMNEFIKNIYEIQSVPKSFFINEYGHIDAFFNGLISFEEMENSILNKN